MPASLQFAAHKTAALHDSSVASWCHSPTAQAPELQSPPVPLPQQAKQSDKHRKSNRSTATYELQTLQILNKWDVGDQGKFCLNQRIEVSYLLFQSMTAHSELQFLIILKTFLILNMVRKVWDFITGAFQAVVYHILNDILLNFRKNWFSFANKKASHFCPISSLTNI